MPNWNRTQSDGVKMTKYTPKIHYDHRMGHGECDPIAHIQSRIRLLTEKYPHLYVGITQQRPGIRLWQHNSYWDDDSKWEKMYIIYEAKDLNELSLIEGEIIKFCLNEYSNHTWNSKNAARPAQAKNPAGHALYVMVDAKIYS